MNIPKYWAEGRVQHREKGRQVTIRRFGWSRTSESEAQAIADTRAREALRRVLSGEKLARREPKVAYNGAEGVPIREEIVAEHGDVVITRNSYGALCLNSPDVLFADVDLETSPSSRFGCGLSLALLAGAGVLAWDDDSFKVKLFLLLSLPCVVAGFGLARLVRAAFLKSQGGAKQLAERRIDEFARAHPDWRLRVYQTPAGFRVMATQRTFAPDEAPVSELFSALHTDPIYVAMCQRQQCFRARVSPKPWRMGVDAHIKPARAVWPVTAEALAKRKAWVDVYHQKASSYSSCRFLRELGGGTTCERVNRVVELHDKLCRAQDNLPIA